MFLEFIQNVVYFSPFDDPMVQIVLEEHIFGRMDELQQFLFGRGMLVISLIFTPILILLVQLGMRTKLLSKGLLKVRNALMWSSLIRSQI